jgi:Restriction endonuclease NotI
MTKVLELFGESTLRRQSEWKDVVGAQQCAYTSKKCYKIRKSDPETSIGTCTVAYGSEFKPVVICPIRMTQGGQIFTDCIHLLTTHEPGNELHVVSEVSIPGGSVDFFLVSARNGKVKDFVGIEIQTLDTTGTVWPERQRFLRDAGVPIKDKADASKKSFGMNWKMTAKTILLQMHHKARTFEQINKKLVLVVQDRLLSYMTSEFKFDHLRSPTSIGDSVHFHPYELNVTRSKSFQLELQVRLSTDADGIATCLGMQAEAKVELADIVEALESKISKTTRFRPV